MSKKTYAEGIVFDATHVPDGYVPQSNWSGNKRHHNALCKACESNRIRRIRFKRSADDRIGRMFVHQEDADGVIRESDQRHSTKTAAKTVVSVPDAVAATSRFDAESVCESLADIASSLSSVERLLERLATAVESIATQPKASQHDFANSINGNPAPWNET